MSNLEEIKRHMMKMGWFREDGAYVSVDGQYGSTGKGVINGLMAEMFRDRVDVVSTNAGPNSGHTTFYNGEKIVLKQLPTFSVVAALARTADPNLFAPDVKTVINSGAIINPEILDAEVKKYLVRRPPYVEGRAAIITEACIAEDVTNVKGVASTGQGIGPAMIGKLKRTADAVKDAQRKPFEYKGKVYIEASQGFSLGINQPFYPKVTTRECTVAQALSDAGISPKHFRKSVMSVRTFPIRVGSTENSSGAHYPDQKEITFEDLGVKPEYTTVTKRMRRIFTWSDQQFRASIRTNTPDAIFVNFMNYLDEDVRANWVEDNIVKPYVEEMGYPLETVLLGHGPMATDVELY